MKLDLVIIQHDLERLVILIEDLNKSGALDQDAKNVISSMMDDICTFYSKIEQMLSPYYLMKDVGDFDRDFGKKFSGFKEVWLTTDGDVNNSQIASIKNSCTKVQGELFDASKKINWNALKPWLRNELKRISELNRAWFLGDEHIYEIMEDLVGQVRDGLSEVENVRRTSTHEAFAQLQLFISDSKPSYDKMKFRLDSSICKRHDDKRTQ